MPTILMKKNDLFTIDLSKSENPFHDLMFQTLLKVGKENLWEKYPKRDPEGADGYFCKTNDYVINIYEENKEINLATYGDPTIIFYPTDSEFISILRALNQNKLN